MSKKDNKLSKHAKEQKKKREKERKRKEKRKAYQRKKNMKKYTTYLIAALAIGSIVWGFTGLTDGSSPEFSREDALKANLQSHGGIAYHIHPQLTIEVNGEQQLIPSNTGITNAGMRVIHTHDASGTLHVEPPYPVTLYLKDFFTIWGEQSEDNRSFNQTCIFDYCENETHELNFFVNGQTSEEYGELELKDGQLIRIVYEER